MTLKQLRAKARSLMRTANRRIDTYRKEGVINLSLESIIDNLKSAGMFNEKTDRISMAGLDERGLKVLIGYQEELKDVETVAKYKKKVVEFYGEEANNEVISSIAKEKYTDDIQVSDNKQLFYDEFSHRYFESTLEDVIKAEYNTNRNLQCNGGVYLNEYYEFLGLEPIPGGNELGWSSGILESHYYAEWIEFDHEKVVLEDDLECCIITLRYEPVIDFAYY